MAVISPVVRTRKERWNHDDSQNDVLCGAPLWGVQNTSMRRCRHFGGKWSYPLMRARYLGCCLADLTRELDQKLSDGQLEDIRLPSNGLKWEIVGVHPN